MRRILLLSCVIALLAAAPAGAQDFTRYVALGDSLTAGFASNGLVQRHQEGSYPALLAQQAGTPDFQLPLVSEPGLPPLLELVSLDGPIIQAPQVAPGLPINAELPRPYNNLGVPGATTYDLLFTTGDITNLLAGNTDNVMHDLILRFPVFPGTEVPAPAIAQAIALEPTFVTMWIGSNDFLPAILTATPLDGVTMTPVSTFQELYTQAAGALAQMTTADVVVFTLLENLSSIPFISTVPPVITVPGVGQFPVIGSNGPLTPDDFITLPGSALLAQGIGIPTALGGTGIPLPEDLDLSSGTPGFVIRAAEMDAIEARARAFNDVIRAVAGATGAHVFDVNPIFERLVGGNLWIFGGIELSNEFLVGGVFSYDAIHPQNIGHGIITIELIGFLNEEFGAVIPQVNMSDILCAGGCADGGAPTVIEKADEVVFTTEALKSLLETFPPRLPQPAQARRLPRSGSRLSPH